MNRYVQVTAMLAAMRITPTGPQAEKERDILRRAKAIAAWEGVTLSEWARTVLAVAVDAVREDAHYVPDMEIR